MWVAFFVLGAGLALSSAGTRADDPSMEWTFIGGTQAAAIDVKARVTASLTRVAVRDGDAVAKGDLLAELDPRAYKLDLDAAKARLKVAEAKLQGARLKATNAKKLVQGKVISQDELALNLATEAEAEAAVMVAKVEVDRAELTLSWTRVTAPLSGRVSRSQFTAGGLVTADRTHILTVVVTDPLYVTFSVPEAILLRLRRDGLSEPGKLDVAVGFAIDEGYPHAAKLDLIAPEVDPTTGTVQFRATVPNPKGLLSPGISARVRLTPHPSPLTQIRVATLTNREIKSEVFPTVGLVTDGGMWHDRLTGSGCPPAIGPGPAGMPCDTGRRGGSDWRSW